MELCQEVTMWSSLLCVGELKHPQTHIEFIEKKITFPVCYMFCPEWAIIRLCKTINICKGVTELYYMSWFWCNFSQIAQSCKYSRQFFQSPFISCLFLTSVWKTNLLIHVKADRVIFQHIFLLFWKMKIMYSLLSSFVETVFSFEFIMLCVLTVLEVGFNE